MKIDVAAGEEPLVVFALQAGGVIQGAVTTPEGEPIAGVKVGVRGCESLGPTMTNRHGQYRLENIPLSASNFTLSASLNGLYATRVRITGFRPGQRRMLQDLRLERGFDLEGRTLNCDGSPVPGAAIHFSGGARVEPISSDEKGRFRLEAATKAISRMTACKAGYAPVTVKLEDVLLPENRQQIDLVLGPAHFLAGTVKTRSGEPLRRAYVYVDPVPTPAGPNHAGETDPAGWFLIEDLPRELFMVTALKEGYAPAFQMHVEPDREELRLVMEEGGQIRGIVVEAFSGRPIRPFSVKIVAFEDADSRGLFGEGGLRSVSVDGSFAIRHHLRSGRLYRLVLVAEGYREAIHEPVEAWPLSEVREPLVIELKKATKLDGKVVSATRRRRKCERKAASTRSDLKGPSQGK